MKASREFFPRSGRFFQFFQKRAIETPSPPLIALLLWLFPEALNSLMLVLMIFHRQKVRLYRANHNQEINQVLKVKTLNFQTNMLVA